MSKIICDVCGTKYPDSAEQCPICGRIRETSGEAAAENFVTEEIELDERPKVRGGRFSKSNVRKRNREMPHYEMEEQKNSSFEEDDEDFDEELEPREKSNTVINILLVVVIFALLVVTGYIFTQFVLPNVLPAGESTPATEETIIETQQPTETEEPNIPCTGLSLDEAVVLLEREGQEWLVNVSVMPEDTTDELVFSSADESVVMIDADGKVTAVGEGDTTITITCGDQQAHCTIAVVYEEEETEAPEESTGESDEETTGTDETTGSEETAGTEETEAPKTEETDGPTEPLKNVTLTLKQSDVTFRSKGQAATFKLTCGLKATEVKWSSENEAICTVDKNGVVTRTGKGTTNVVVKYGEQEVKVIVRCP